MLKSNSFQHFDCSRIPSPCFVVDEVALEKNLQVLQKIQSESGAKILMALKAFAMHAFAPLISEYLQGTCASGIHEARLGKEKFGGEVHTYSAAFKENELKEVLGISDHVIFNSFNQWQKFQPLIQEAKQARPDLRFGLRVNPLHSEGANKLYDPCVPGSRLGIPFSQFQDKDLSGISGLHFHTLCEQGYDPLDRTLQVFEKQFADYLPELEWVNFGGGHLITDPDYDIEKLIARIQGFQQRYQVQVYLEPGEAIAIHTGVLVTEVVDIIQNEMAIAILDCSATCHMPDTLEMPYRADVFGAGIAGQKPHTYRLGGVSCLAGDVMGDYSFEQPLQVGQRLKFDDMSHYTMVKTTTFNGIALPAIAIWNSRNDELRLVKKFSYDDFKNRLS